jgi:hypothetical protein
MVGPYAAVGARLVERGYAAIPIMPGSKRPGELKRGEWIGKENWREEYSRRLPSRFEIQVWSHSSAGVCVVTGPGSKHTVAIDIDTDDVATKAAIESALPPTTVRKRGAKGETLFYRGPDIAESKSWNIGKSRVCDLIGPGRQTVLPPTIHPDTNQPYLWTGPDALEDVDPADLPEITPAHIEAIGPALAPFGWKAEPERPARPAAGYTRDDSDPWKRLNDKAIANLDAWVPALNLYRCQRVRAGGYEAVAVWRASNTGNPIEKRKLNLKIHPDGITDFGDGPRGYSAIDLVMAAQSSDFDSAYDWLEALVDPSDVIIALKPKMPRPAPAEPASAPEPEAGPTEGGESDNVTRLPEAPGGDLKKLAFTDGLVGELVQWMVDTARREDAVLALGAAVTVIGTLAGRRLCGPTESGTHLYVVGLAPTGGGKQHPLNCITKLLTAAKAEAHIGPSEFISMPAVINRLLESPLCLCPQDEFGAFLKRANGKRASGFESSISKVLRSAWGSSFQAMSTPDWAGRKMEIINAPALSLFGVSTPEEFYSALQGEDVSNGFLNRFLIIESTSKSRQHTPKIEFRVPEHIINALQSIYPANNPTLRSRLNDFKCMPEPRQIMWANPKAHDAYYDFSNAVDDEREANPELDPYLSRAAEIGIRLATIRALGRWRSDDCAVDASDIEWGRDVAYTCAKRVGRQAAEAMVVEMNHGQIVNKIIETVRKHGGRVQHWKVSRALQKVVRNKKELTGSIDILVEAGTLRKEQVTPPAGGQPTVWYSMAS